MMIGKRISFEYISCKECHCLFINDIPVNLKDFYINYYTSKKKFTLISKTIGYLWKMRSSLTLIGLYPVIRLVSRNSILDWLNCIKIDFSDAILDVGCGNGDVLYELTKHGFFNLSGVDPFPPKNSNVKFNWKFIKGDIFSIHNKKFKLIMFNHSLEHTFEHKDILTRAKELLCENGRIMVRMPLINKAFEDYKEYWAQLDAPRHLLIHSRKSFDILCANLGLKIYKVLYDSTEFQFMGSIQYKNNIAYNDPDSYKVYINSGLFSAKEINNYKSLSKHYNKLGLGDQAAFFLKSI